MKNLNELNINKVKQFWHSVKKYGMPKDGGYGLGERLGFSKDEVDQIKQAAADYRNSQKEQEAKADNEFTGCYICHQESEKAIMLHAVYTTSSLSLGSKTHNVWIPKSQASYIGTDPSGNKVYAVKGWLLSAKQKEIPANFGAFEFQYFDFIGQELVTKEEF